MLDIFSSSSGWLQSAVAARAVMLGKRESWESWESRVKRGASDLPLPNTHTQNQKGTILTCQREFMFTATGQLSKAAPSILLLCHLRVCVVCVCACVCLCWCGSGSKCFSVSPVGISFWPFSFGPLLLPHSFGTHIRAWVSESRMQMIHKYQHFCWPAIENAQPKVASNLSPSLFLWQVAPSLFRADY